MRKTLSAAMLVLALSCPAAAGVIHNPEPEPPSATADGIIHTGQPSAASDGIIQNGQPTVAGEIPNNVTGTLTQIVLTALSVLP